MKFSHYIPSLLVLATLLACAATEDLDLDALKDTLLKLCNANTMGKFGSCCRASSNGQDITTVGSLPSCFGSAQATPSGAITKLFVSIAIHSFEHTESHPPGP